MLSEQIISRLSNIVGAERLLLDAEELQYFGVDRTTIWQANPSAVVLPGTIEEVKQVVLLANECNLVVVPSGGRTGLSGGGSLPRLRGHLVRPYWQWQPTSQYSQARDFVQ